MNHNINQNKASALAWLMWGLTAAFFFLDYLSRVAPSVMYRYIQVDFGINEAGLGILIASFYIPCILMQIPVGLTVDRVSVRTILSSMSLMAAVGCVVFGMADGLVLGTFGRILIGLGSVFSFISALRLATAWFPPAQLGLIVGLTQTVGKLGAIVGQAPVSWLVSGIGWRYTMMIIALLFAVLAILLYCFIQDAPGTARHQYKPENQLSIRDSLLRVITNRQSWLNALYAGFLFAPTAIIGEYIGPVFLQYGLGFNAHTAALAISLIFVGLGISSPLSGWISDKLGHRKPIMIISAVSGVVLTSLLIYYPAMSSTAICLLLLIFGITNTGLIISYAVSMELHEKQVRGMSIALTSMISILTGVSMQMLVGVLLDQTSGSRSNHIETLKLADFQAGLWILPLFSLIALMLTFTIRETFCSRNKSAQ